MKFHMIRLDRDDELPIEFHGAEIGHGDLSSRHRDDSQKERGTSVTIYATETAKIVVHIVQWDDKRTQEPSSRCYVCADMPSALESLKNDNNGSLGKASKIAWQQACAAADFPFAVSI